MSHIAGYCLNTATIRGQKLGIVEEVKLAAKVGYDAVEPWVESVEQYKQAGGSLKDLRKLIADLGLRIPGAIAFATWLADQKARRAAGLERAKRDMDLLRQIGGTGMAAPPWGMIKRRGLDSRVAGERYRALLEVGEKMGVTPQLELWGFSTAMCRLGEVAMAVVEAAHDDACMVLDVYHIYKGGNDFTSLKAFACQAVAVLHMNDYPARPSRAKIDDAHRVYPGDGIAPMSQVLRDLDAGGFRGWLSLELFSEAYWKQPALKVAKAGLAKMKAAVRKAKGR